MYSYANRKSHKTAPAVLGEELEIEKKMNLWQIIAFPVIGREGTGDVLSEKMPCIVFSGSTVEGLCSLLRCAAEKAGLGS